jgi:hypothetical protein
LGDRGGVVGGGVGGDGGGGGVGIFQEIDGFQVLQSIVTSTFVHLRVKIPLFAAVSAHRPNGFP